MKSEEWVKAELKRMCEHYKKLCLLKLEKGSMYDSAEHIALGRISVPEKGSVYDSAEYIALGRISVLEEILED